jgi:putative salt-induced outer membrane protein YdiY
VRTSAVLILMCFLCLGSQFAAAQAPLFKDMPGLSTPVGNPNLPLIPPQPPSPLRRLPPVGNSLSPKEWVAAPISNEFLLEPTLEETVQPPPEPILTPLPENTDIIIPSADDVVIRLPKVKPNEDPDTKLWSGSLQFGMDGVEGNSQSMNLRFGLDVRRKTDLHLLFLNADYSRMMSNYNVTSNRSYSQARYERIIPDTNWTIFEGATGEYDQFQPYVFRVTDYAGVGYWLFRNPQASLKTRFGGGFEHDFQGPHEDYYSPELLLGFDYERKISNRQRLTAMLEYMPNVTNSQTYRVNTQVGWELLVDQEMNLSLRFAVRNRYTSDPGTGRPNDLDYAALLMWKF